MAFQATVYRVFVASPSDVGDERKAIRGEIGNWNALNGEEMKALLLPVMWETDSWPEQGDRTQAVVNRQLNIDGCDMLIGVFWTRIGTPTGKAESGTIEEIEQIRAAGKPTMLYFSDVPVASSKIDTEQLNKLNEFKKSIRDTGIYSTFHTIDALRPKLSSDLTRLVRNFHIIANPRATEDARTSAINRLRRTINGILAEYEYVWRRTQVVAPSAIDWARKSMNEIGTKLSNARHDMSATLSEEIMASIEKIANDTIAFQMVAPRTNDQYAQLWNDGRQIFIDLRDLLALLSGDDEER